MGNNRLDLYRQYERLGVALIRCMEQLKTDSSDGIGTYYHTVEEIEDLMQVCAWGEQSESAIEQPLTSLHEAAENQDAAALSDVLENKVYPIVMAWLQKTQET